MKTCGLTLLVCLVAFCPRQSDAGWTGWKFWQKKTDHCTAPCVDECCNSDCCYDDCTECCQDSCTDPLRPMLFSGRLFSGSGHWLSRICGEECCEVDLCCDDSCCDLISCPDQCCEDGCCSYVEIVRRDRTKWLAEWIYRYETSCSTLDRCRAIHRIGTDFSCECYPEVMCVLIHALRDCEDRVRVEAADEIGDQLRKSRCCCNSHLISALCCALHDCNWRVRREAAQALRLCGYSVPYRDGKYCVDGCLDGCCDGCCDGCVDTCCPTCEVVPSAPIGEPTPVPVQVEESVIPMPEPETVKPKAEMIEPKPAPAADKPKKGKKNKKKEPTETNPEPLPGKDGDKAPGKYVPDEDSTTFVMPNIRQLAGLN